VLLRRVLSASAVTSCFLVLLNSGAGRAQAPCEPPAARVVSIQGAVELKRAGTDVWTPAMLEEALCIGDALRVGQASRAALALANDSILRLDQRTTLQLRGIAEEERSLLELLFGAVYFFSHRPRALEVDTPFVNAAAEGTEFLVRVGDDRAEVVMLDGQVLLRNPHGELRVASGEAALVAEGEAPAPMIVVRPRDAVAWALYYPPILAELAGRGVRPRPLPPGLQDALGRVAANDYASALRSLETVPEAARDARYYTYLAGVLLNVGRVEEAEAAIERALALDPEAGEALAQRAIIHVVQNRQQDALADARRAVELNPESSAARIALSYALQAAFQLEEARAVLREAVERNPEDALAWARLAELELMFGDLDAAEEAAERAVALAPGLSRTHMVVGFAALTRIDIDEAKAAFERAIALDSANPLLRLGLGLAKIRESNLEEGRQEIEIAAALDPNDALIRSYLGKAYFEERRDPLAGEQYAMAKELDPNDPTPWFYDAIRLQLDNRPVEALRSLERSIELNDNRAVYRSRLLLDEDLAVRQTSLARIYDDLGFEQLGLVEATKSLNLDAANFSAHRFLSDTYARLPRHEVARASELLQAQLLQPININPVQPSLLIADLNTVAAGGPTAVGFNEFNPLFQRNQLQVNAAGLLGTNNTFGEEIVVNGLYNRLSVSAGQFLSRTDGFRKNNDVDNDLYNFFGQFDVTPKVSVQAEYRRRDSKHGDLVLSFDLSLLMKSFSARSSRTHFGLGAE
jgi:tetratricopeptide (TPR) repeat protein